MQKRSTSRARHLSFGNETLSGKSFQECDRDAELSGDSGSIRPGQDDLHGESIPGQPRDRILSWESKNMMSKSEGD